MSARRFLRWPSKRGVLRIAAVALAIGLLTPQAWAWYHLRAAKRALAEYHPEKAQASLKSCERVWNNRASVRLLASRAARQNGDYEAARSELLNAQRLLGGATEETALEWALLEASTGNVSEVDAYLQKRADRSPEEAPLIWEALTVGYLTRFRTLDAMSCVNHWLKHDPENLRALELRGITYITGKGVVRGAEDLRRVLERDPRRDGTRWQLAGCLLALGSYGEAAENLEHLDQRNPGNPEVAARLARCYSLVGGRSHDARRVIEAALARDPDHPACLRTRGQMALTDPNDPRKDEAEAFLRRAAALLPEDYQAQQLLVAVLRERGKDTEAKAQLAVAEAVKDRGERIAELSSRRLAEQPLDPALHYEMGTLMVRTGRPDDGARWFTLALGLDPEHRLSHAALAEYHEARGNKALAEEHRKKATP